MYFINWRIKLSTSNITDSFSKLSLYSDKEFKEDWEHISNKKDNVVAGFLNIGNKDGWKPEEGGLSETGFRFTRCMLRKFWEDNGRTLSDYKDIFERVVPSFSPSSRINESLPKCFVDPSVNGWSKHAVTRIVGCVGSKDTGNGPYFEIFINSARPNDAPRTTPFQSFIILDKASAMQRWQSLVSAKNFPFNAAYPLFYQSQPTPDSFIDQYRKDHEKNPGPHAMRLLEGLKLLNQKIMKAQTIGNCWMIQNKREVLAVLFIETLTERPELTPQETWNLSKILYRKWKKHARQEIESLMQGKGMCLDLVKIAREKLAKKS